MSSGRLKYGGYFRASVVCAKRYTPIKCECERVSSWRALLGRRLFSDGLVEEFQQAELANNAMKVLWIEEKAVLKATATGRS